MKRILSALLILVLCLGLCGCGSWTQGNYVSVTPHPQQNEYREIGELYATSYREIRGAITQLIADGAPKGIIFLSRMSDEVARSYIKVAIEMVLKSDPVAVYAVDSVSYEFGTNTGRNALAVEITYNKSRSDLQRIKWVDTMQEAEETIGAVLEQAGSSIVVRIDAYEQTDIEKLVRDYADAHPENVMETPRIMAAVYPDKGRQRLVELSFSYQTDAETLLQMKELVWPVFTAAKLYVQGNAPQLEKYQQLYSFLMERYDYTLESSVTPAYSLLQQGVGDSRAFASVYAAMCKKAGLACQIISGTKDGVSYCWNRICVDDTWYCVDLLDAYPQGRLILRNEGDMVGYQE